MITINPKMRYSAYKVQHYMTKNGQPYTHWTLGDSQKDSNGNFYTKEYYSLTSYQPELSIFADGDKYNITKINGVDTNEVNGRKFINLVVEINVVSKSQQPSNQQNNGFSNFPKSNMVTVEPEDIEENNFSSFNIMEDDIQF